ncbi:hypothetical protein TCAL_10535, partial [Tigriopus californicus]
MSRPNTTRISRNSRSSSIPRTWRIPLHFTRHGALSVTERCGFVQQLPHLKITASGLMK